MVVVKNNKTHYKIKMKSKTSDPIPSLTETITYECLNEGCYYVNAALTSRSLVRFINPKM